MVSLHHLRFPALALSGAALLAAAACGSTNTSTTASADSPTTAHEAVGDTTKTGATATSAALRPGSVEAGRDVYRFETFGTEGFWTNAVRMPQGMAQAKLTVLDALKAGVSFDVDAIPADLKTAFMSEVRTDLSPGKAPRLNDPAVMTQLVKANAVIGMVPKGNMVGVSCSLCHGITDKSMFALSGDRGTIGKRIDGPTPHQLNVGKLLATGANTRALMPVAQLQNPDGSTIGRAPKGLTANSTEAEFDAYFSNPKYYPLGMFDDSPDGNGNPVHIAPFFRQDLAAPYGSSGQNGDLNDFNNTVYTALFDQTNLTTPGGATFIHILGGTAGDSLIAGYKRVLAATGVQGIPFVTAHMQGKAGELATPTGKRVDEQKLRDLQAYLNQLPAPKGVVTDAALVAKGRALFVSQNCTQCHNTNQGQPVQSRLIPMNVIWPGYAPKVIAMRQPPLSPIQNAPGTFDDKMIVVDASPGGGIRGNALPLLLDLARKPVFLHDDEVKGLDALFDPKRGAKAPHPFYVVAPADRAALVAYMKSLDTDSK
ncbi:c-type cytochrome [Hymenobacter sp. RP-2-7]|uniref:C-type cytochrome n=1 Tax=Hymenobacter polaris TaxID=2682546 RepID=A0A7Y0AHV4_9BACT|nr:c-type cytochrome [Hymenobacter polaris]NML67676.1 c-type cytochrome [Hymenobacter polaris]